MNQEALKQIIKVGVLESTLRNPEFCKPIDRGIVDAHRQVFTPGRPPYSSYPASPYWHQVIKHVHGELRASGFTLDWEKNQLRLLSLSAYECPVRLRFAMGEIKGGVAYLAADKGEMTKKGVLQNGRYFRQQPLLSPTLSLYNQPMVRELNLWVLYQPQPKFVTVWLGLCVDWLTSRTFQCDESTLICSRAIDDNVVNVRDILPVIEDGGYNIELEDQPTGT